MLSDASSCDDPAAGGRAEIGPLVGMPFAQAARVHLLQASNVGIYLPQHRADSARIVTPINPDAGMNIVGDDPDRRDLRGDASTGETCSGMVRLHSLPDLVN